jgi:uncharacterized caspase-like protein
MGPVFGGPSRTALIILLLVLFLSACSPPNRLPPPGYAIVYGVADYNGTTADLAFSDDDAQDMAAVLAESGYTVILRTDSDATKANLLADFQSLSTSVETESRFLFYFAGHGFGDGMASQYSGLPPEWKEYFNAATGEDEPAGAGPYTDYIFLHDAMPVTSDVEATLDEGVSDDELAELVRSIPSTGRIVIIDACHSGGFLGTSAAVDTVPRAYDGGGDGVSIIDLLSAMTLYLEHRSFPITDIAEGEAIVLAAAGEQDFSYEFSPASGIENGVFTYYLIESASYGDADFDGVITTSEAYAYARDSIALVENESLTGEGKFFPRTSGGAVDFVLFY